MSSSQKIYLNWDFATGAYLSEAPSPPWFLFEVVRQALNLVRNRVLNSTIDLNMEFLSDTNKTRYENWNFLHNWKDENLMVMFFKATFLSNTRLSALYRRGMFDPYLGWRSTYCIFSGAGWVPTRTRSYKKDDGLWAAALERRYFFVPQKGKLKSTL